MTLTTHGITGAVVVSFLPTHPILGLTLAVLSHFVLDSLPHWDYRILSLDQSLAKKGVIKMIYGSKFFLDLIRIGFDASLGFILAIGFSLWLTGDISGLLLGGAFMGMLPDGLQFVYGRTKWKILGVIQKFHNIVHTDWRLSNKYIFGILSQLIFISLIIWFRFNI